MKLPSKTMRSTLYYIFLLLSNLVKFCLRTILMYTFLVTNLSGFAEKKFKSLRLIHIKIEVKYSGNFKRRTARYVE
jgi:hypothetical protein